MDEMLSHHLCVEPVKNRIGGHLKRAQIFLQPRRNYWQPKRHSQDHSCTGLVWKLYKQEVRQKHLPDIQR